MAVRFRAMLPDPDSFVGGRVDGAILDPASIDDDIARRMPLPSRASVASPHRLNCTIATGVAGAVGGALAGAGYVPARALDRVLAADEACHKR